MTQTGKAARRKFGTRYAAKRAKARKKRPQKSYGSLPYSVLAKNVRSEGGLW